VSFRWIGSFALGVLWAAVSVAVALQGLVACFLGGGCRGEGRGDAGGQSRAFTSVLIQMQQQAERDARARAAAQRRAQVEADRARRAFERAAAADQKERARLYTESRIAEMLLSTTAWLPILPR
jgi:hypothetical protein